MAKRAVRWTKTADIQYIGILEYWVKRNKTNTYSKKLIKMVAERIKQIAETPFIYKSAESLFFRTMPFLTSRLLLHFGHSIRQTYRIYLKSPTPYS